MPPILGLGGRGGGERGRAVRVILATGDTGVLSIGSGGGGEKSGGSMCSEVEVVSGIGTWHRDSSPRRVSSKSSKSRSGAMRVALAEWGPEEVGMPPQTSGWAILKKSSASW